MSTFKISKTQKSRDPGVVHSGDQVLVRLLNGEIKCVKVEKNANVVIGKFGTFLANDLIGQPYGVSYEIVDKRLKYHAPRTMEEVEDTDATNEYINDGEFVQPLTVDEIQSLKRAGVHASDIIKKQIEQHANYSLKTEYSKEKYKKRKEAKYHKIFTTIEPTLFNVAQYWWAKDQNRLRDLRIDALSQMLNMANIHPGGRYLAVDDASGLLVAGILERMGGQGKLITICHTDSPPAYPVLDQMNFDPSVTDVLKSLNWATAEEDYVPILPPSEPPEGQLKSDRQKYRLNKRKVISDLLSNTREELFSGEFDSLLVATEYNALSILERLTPYLAGSAPIVVHSPFSSVIIDLQAKLRNIPQYLSPTMTETWLRQYQVLPGRTHPMMAMSGSGGFMLQTTKIYDDPTAEAALLQRRKNKKPKAEGADTPASATPAPATARPTPTPEVPAPSKPSEKAEGTSSQTGTDIDMTNESSS